MFDKMKAMKYLVIFIIILILGFNFYLNSKSKESQERMKTMLDQAVKNAPSLKSVYDEIMEDDHITEAEVQTMVDAAKAMQAQYDEDMVLLKAEYEKMIDINPEFVREYNKASQDDNISLEEMVILKKLINEVKEIEENAGKVSALQIITKEPINWDLWKGKFLAASEAMREKMGTQFMDWYDQKQAQHEKNIPVEKKLKSSDLDTEYVKRGRGLLDRLMWFQKVIEEAESK